MSGIHCETTTLGVLLDHIGYELSEAMIFGLGSGLSFIYWDSKSQDRPFVGGRVKPYALTETLTDRLHLTLHTHETTSARTAWENIRQPLDDGTPVGLQLDSYYLEYFTTKVHFGGHVVAMTGYDEADAFLVDTAQQGGVVTTSLTSLASARAARGPMSARHRSFTIETNHSTDMSSTDLVTVALQAMVECATNFLNPPIANIGHRGIHTTATRMTTWLDRVSNPRDDLGTIAMIMERAGTGGGLFRNLYGDFLTECSNLIGESSIDVDQAAIDASAELFHTSAQQWTNVSELIAQAGETSDVTMLVQASHIVQEIAEIETSAMTLLQSLEDVGEQQRPR